MRSIEGKRALAAIASEVTDIASVLMVLMDKWQNLVQQKSLFKADQKSAEGHANVEEILLILK